MSSTLGKRFRYHEPDPAKFESYERIRGAGQSLAEIVTSRCPNSRERSIALTKIEEAVMWAERAITMGG